LTRTPEKSTARPAEHDAVIVGAGFAGLHMLHRLRGMGLSAIVLEEAPDVGGTWYWNRYPGARCDVESLVYSYSFSPELEDEWRWSERYAGQPEIHAYLRFAAERLDLRKDIRFETTVTGAAFDERSDRWTLDTDQGETFQARFCIMAAGPLSHPIWPDIPGLRTFRGELLHTARWPESDVSLAGKRIGVIGTGSSGTQVIPAVAGEAEHLFVFVRTPNFTVPARNRALTDVDRDEWARRREELRTAQRLGELVGSGDVLMAADLRATRMTASTGYTEAERRDIIERRFACGGAAVQQCFNDILTNKAINEELAEFMREHVRNVVVDPELADILTPRGFAVGTRRICIDTGYYEAFNRDNVELVDVRTTPIERITPIGVRVGARDIALDVLIAATGFDALTGAITAVDIRGTDGRTIAEAWREGPRTYLGLAMAGFPNLFVIGGPGSPSVLTNVVYINEFQVDFIGALIGEVSRRGLTRVEASAESQDLWTEHVDDLVRGTVLENADSWYLGTNVPGKARRILAYAGGIARYQSSCDSCRDGDYEGFRITAASEAPLTAASYAREPRRQ
jgi:cyclohexanone monooxygenase